MDAAKKRSGLPEGPGRVNVYKSKGGTYRSFHTVNLTRGVTPFIVILGGEEYTSGVYRLSFWDTTTVAIERGWYRPCPEEFAQLPESVQGHVLNAGLLHAPLREAALRQCQWDTLIASGDADYEMIQALFLANYGRRHPASPTPAPPG